jgi:hypothetical protein
MRKILLTLLLSSFVLSLFSQEDSVLRNFKFRINRYRAISINIDGGSQFSRAQLGSGKNTNQSSNASTGASFYQTTSTDKILLTMSGNLGTGFNFSKSESPSSIYKNRGYSLSPYFKVLNKWFSRKSFVELGAEAFTSINSSKYTQNTPGYNQKNSLGRHGLSITVGIGKGRLENITDMQNALWLSKALEKEGRLSRSLSFMELNDLGRTITSSNNTRVLDARKRTQFILETIDNYFQQKGLISKTDIKYFSNLNDIVFFAINNPRLSGTEIFARLTPAIDNQHEKATEKIADTKNTEDFTTKSVGLSIGLNKYIPLNLRHQNNYGVNAQLTYLSHRYIQRDFAAGIVTNETDFSYDIKQVSINAFFERAIYPNTRTTASFKLDGQAGYMDTGGYDGFFGVANLSGTLNYFISYRTRFIANLGVSYQNNLYNVNSYFSIEPERLALFANAGLQVNL